MESSPSHGEKSSRNREWWGGMMVGFGGGLLLATVILQPNSVSDLKDVVRIAGFALLFIGMAIANPYKPWARPDRKKPEK